jgi:uncharacterized membrane protein YcaP (DUF421 family)
MAHELWLTAGRAVAIYALMLVVIRLLGKRAVGNFSAFDLLVALMLGEVVDEIIYGDVTFLQGAVAIAVIAAADYTTSWLSYGNRRLSGLLEGTPLRIVEDGRLQRKAMRRERMNEEEVLAELRVQGVEDLREVKWATIETSGEISILKQEWAEPLRKGDLPGTPETSRRAAADRSHPRKT